MELIHSLPLVNIRARRIEIEKKTVSRMIGMYCHGKHGSSQDLCSECEQIHTYAMQRLDHCVFGNEKPFCSACPVHCYKKSMREQIKEVMRYAGPRMLYTHPGLAVLHMFARFSKPEAPRKNK
jgi:hypothetical protein